jgi:superfamily I DNA and/or RNA helicase
LFSREDFHPSFDYLFVDEAGQVSIANIVAMATCAKNAVLVGDQCSSLSPPSAGWI